MAEGVLRQMMIEESVPGVVVASAGIAAASGFPASAHAVTACRERGIDISGHRSRPLTREILAETDLVLTMEMHHLYAAKSFSPGCADRMYLLSHYAEGTEDAAPFGVEDPIGGDLDEYRAALTTIGAYLEKALPRIAEVIRTSARES